MSKLNGNENIGKESSIEFLRRIEKNALALRERAGVGPTGRLDPMQAADKLGIVLAQPGDMQELLGEEYSVFCSLEPTIWSGAAKKLPNGKLFIMLNPNQTTERSNVTVLEEVAHVHYGHQPVQFNELMQYEYADEAEEEAYQTAAAALLPMKIVARTVWEGGSAESLAAEYGTSTELVKMRIKRLNLWSQYTLYTSRSNGAL